MDCSTPGIPALHNLPACAQIHVHWVDDAIQPSQPLSRPSSLALNPFQHQGLFQWISSLPQVLELQLKHQPLQWIFRTDFLQDWLVLSPCCPRDSQESSSVPQFKSINFSALSFPYGPTLTPVHDYKKNYSFDYTDLCQQSDVSAF